VRSIASQLARIARRGKTSVALSMYVVSFSEELSAFDARTVAKQASFAVEVLLHLHQQGKPIFVIAHSMGASLFVAHNHTIKFLHLLGPENGESDV
jgi:alpha-beta hydrolase superfamily lysophospholipase